MVFYIEDGMRWNNLHSVCESSESGASRQRRTTSREDGPHYPTVREALESGGGSRFSTGHPTHSWPIRIIFIGFGTAFDGSLCRRRREMECFAVSVGFRGLGLVGSVAQPAGKRVHNAERGDMRDPRRKTSNQRTPAQYLVNFILCKLA